MNISEKSIMFDIREWDSCFKDKFHNKDFITLTELLWDYESLIDEVEELKEEPNDDEDGIWRINGMDVMDYVKEQKIYGE